ncbi:MAG: hypothetical protein VCA36_11090 [Opitutales bacterium]
MKNLFYLLLGLPSSGRREILLDLATDTKALILLPENEPSHPLDSELAKISSTCLKRWRWKDHDFDFGLAHPSGADIFFLVTDGMLNPIDQIEATKQFLQRNELTLGRILTVAHCGLAATHPELEAWHQACIHFSDVVLLNHREKVTQKWLKEFQNGFRREYLPCLIEYVKKGRVGNPAHILDPTPRRLSLYFDEVDEPFLLEENDDYDDLEEDPYLAKYPSGKRCKPIADPKVILSAADAGLT